MNNFQIQEQRALDCCLSIGSLLSAIKSGFCSIKWLGVVHPTWCDYPQQLIGTCLHTWVERGTVRVKCLAQEHNAVAQQITYPEQLEPESTPLTITLSAPLHMRLHGVFKTLFVLTVRLIFRFVNQTWLKMTARSSIQCWLLKFTLETLSTALYETGEYGHVNMRTYREVNMAGIYKIFTKFTSSRQSVLPTLFLTQCPLSRPTYLLKIINKINYKNIIFNDSVHSSRSCLLFKGASP